MTYADLHDRYVMAALTGILSDSIKHTPGVVSLVRLARDIADEAMKQRAEAQDRR